MPELNAVLEGKYMDKRFLYWPKPQELPLEEILTERVITGNICWFYWEKFYSLLKNAPKGIVLDLACGPGFLSIMLAKAGHQVVGVDISAESIEYAKKLATIHHCAGKIDYQVMDASKLTFPDNTFDIISGEDCLHHVLKYQGTIEGMYRVLKPNGKGYFFEPFGFNPVVNVLRKINLIVCKRDFETVLKQKDLDTLNSIFDRVELSDPSVIYKIPRWVSKFVSNCRKVSIMMRNADVTLQQRFPFLKKYYHAAFIELYKAAGGTPGPAFGSDRLNQAIKPASS